MASKLSTDAALQNWCATSYAASVASNLTPIDDQFKPDISKLVADTFVEIEQKLDKSLVEAHQLKILRKDVEKDLTIFRRILTQCQETTSQFSTENSVLKHKVKKKNRQIEALEKEIQALRSKMSLVPKEPHTAAQKKQFVMSSPENSSPVTIAINGRSFQLPKFGADKSVILVIRQMPSDEDMTTLT